MVTRKTQYALRAVFELAKRHNQGPIRIADIAQAQAIPKRFLELILGQMKQAGIVESHRGNEGGYTLGVNPRNITVGEVLRLVQGSPAPVDCIDDTGQENCPLHGNCVFLPMWERVREAVSDIYDTTSFQYLLEQEARMAEEYIPTYSI